MRALLTARKFIQAKLLDVGLKVGPISRGRFELRVRELVDGHATLETVIDAMLAARTTLETEFKRLHRALLGIVRADPVCRQLMSVPGERSLPSPSRAGSMILRASSACAMSVRTLVLRRGSTSRASSM